MSLPSTLRAIFRKRLPTPRFLILAAGLALTVHAQALDYYITTEPPQPRMGETVSVIVLLPGIEAGGVTAPEPGPSFGLGLESISVSPTSDMPPGEEDAFGTRVVYVFRARDYGDLRIPPLAIEFPRGLVSVRPVTISVLAAPGTPARAPYAWKAPARVLRWQCFSASLESGKPDAPKVPVMSLPASRGVALEPSGERAYVGMALEEGVLSLPPAFTPEGASIVDSRTINVSPAPEGIASSRAVGVFSARVQKPEKTRILAGDTLTVRVEVRGRGNLPILEPPRFTVSPRESGGSESTFPVSDMRVSSGAYEGMAGRVLKFVPRKAGTYTIQAEPFVFWNTEAGRTAVIRFSPVRVVVEPVPVSETTSAAADPSLSSALKDYADRGGYLGTAASLALRGEVAAALDALGSSADSKALHLRGLFLLRAGRTAEALACLGAAERKSRFLPGLQESLKLCEKAQGSISRRKDALPEPPIFFGVSGALLALAFICAAVGRSRGRRRESHRSASRASFQRTADSGDRGATSSAYRSASRASVVTLTALSLVFLAMGGWAALERRTRYAVVRDEAAYSVPSKAGTAVSGEFRGYSGKVAAASGAWTLVKFADGRSAWFPEGTCILY